MAGMIDAKRDRDRKWKNVYRTNTKINRFRKVSQRRRQEKKYVLQYSLDSTQF